MDNNWIIHQEYFCSKILMYKDKKKVVQPVNFICLRALNYQQSKAVLHEKWDTEHGDLVCFSNVLWLCPSATLKRFFDLKSQIQNVMKEKRQDVTFLVLTDFLLTKLQTSSLFSLLTHYCQVFPFDAPWKRPQNKGFVMFLGGIKSDHRAVMS